MSHKRLLLSAAAVFLLMLGAVSPTLAQNPPPYIQPGLKFVYQLFNVEKRQPENAFHNYIIESVTSRGVTLSIQSDVIKSGRVEVSPNGEIEPGIRIDLWIPPEIQEGARFKIFGYDAVVVKKGYQVEQMKLTVVASAQRFPMWFYIEDGPQPYNQLKGLLSAVAINEKMLLGLVNIEQAQTITTRSTFTSTSTRTTARTVETQVRTVREGTTVTLVQTVVETATVRETLTTVVGRTTTVSTTQTVTQQVEAGGQPVFSLPLAVGAAVGIIGGVMFLTRSRRKPLPPTYPYNPYAPPPPPYPQAPQVVGACPACRYPLYAGDFACRRCGYRFA
ncbi:MAG: DUF4179 domain-containing protein [Candidatus Caldarchaeum sp.]